MREIEHKKVDILNSIFSIENSDPLIDVRSPAEFAKGHIVGATNIPLLNNEERAEVGTLYKQVDPLTAFDKGIEIVGPKMANYVKEARKIIGDKEGAVYCWRGGKRSGSMSWLMNMAGLKTNTIPGGYKAYRKKVNEILSSNSFTFLVLGGKTGSGKTLLLHKLKESGEQIIDLESLANHKGSAFGWIGEKDQPSVEHFENLLAHSLADLDRDKVIWIENESRMIGRIPIHQGFWNSLKASPLINIEIPSAYRVKHLTQIYGSNDITDLRLGFKKIEKRLGGLNLKLALEALEQNDLSKAAELALLYYDKSYTNQLEKNETDQIYRLNFEHDSFDKIAKELITFKNKIQIVDGVR